MRNLFLKSTLVVTLSLITSSIYAANFQVPQNRVIVAIRVYDTGFAAIEYSPALTNTLGCSSGVSDRFAVIDWKDDAEKKTMYTAALGAYLIGKTVGLGITDSGGCKEFGGGTPRIYRIDI